MSRSLSSRLSNRILAPLQGTSPTRSLRSTAAAQLGAGSPFAVVSQQRALGDQYEEANAHTWTSGITGSGCGLGSRLSLMIRVGTTLRIRVSI